MIGGHSAALLHGLPLFEKPPSEVCLLVPPGHWSGRRSGVVFRKSGDRLGISPTRPATDVARTWLDIARHHSLADALSVGDAALRGGLLTLEVAEEWAAASTSRRGSRRVPIALQHLNSLRETPLESGSWAYFVAHGLPLPDMQVEYRGVGGQFIGRVDFAWRRHDVVGECDGRLKYTDRDVLYAEKRREDELRALGLTVVRWGMGDLRSDRLAARLRAQLR